MDEGSAILGLVKNGSSRDVLIDCILFLSKLLIVAQIIWLQRIGISMSLSAANILTVTVCTQWAEIDVVGYRRNCGTDRRSREVTHHIHICQPIMLRWLCRT